MILFVPRELESGEQRVPVVPATVEKLVKAGPDPLEIEKGLGEGLGPSRTKCTRIQGAKGGFLIANRASPPSSRPISSSGSINPLAEAGAMKPGYVHISHLDPFREPELVQVLAKAGVSAVSMEMIPRTTIAQKMDALSSQANLAGYVAVILAAERLHKILPMMMTPAGTITPARVFVIGVGVAGLQAIATAKRLGARVEAFDTRPVVEEQVQSLGAKFVKIDLGETGQTKDGYAKELTEEQLAKQRAGHGQASAPSADIVITTAKVFGRKAPLIVTADMVAGMRRGSVVVDLAVETGGNVEGSELDEEVDVNGVTHHRPSRNLPGSVAVHASQMYSSNLGNFIEHFWDKEPKAFDLEPRRRDHPGLPRHPRRRDRPRDRSGKTGAAKGILHMELICCSSSSCWRSFLGFELISKVPSQLHTPLMSGSNAISGITIVGALIAAGPAEAAHRDHRARHARRGLRHDQRGRRLPGHRPHAGHVQEEDQGGK